VSKYRRYDKWPTWGWKTYQLDPPDTAVVPDILSEVEVAHQLENKSKWMRQSGVNAYERHDILAGETHTRQYFIVEPL
jgi:hypothetical protein